MMKTKRLHTVLLLVIVILFWIFGSLAKWLSLFETRYIMYVCKLPSNLFDIIMAFIIYLFLKGKYAPLSTKGSLQDHIIAFQRNFKGKQAITIVSRFFATLLPTGIEFSELETKVTLIKISPELMFPIVSLTEILIQ